MNPAHESCVLHSVFRIQITLTRFLNQLIGWVLYINFSQMFVSRLFQILWDCNYSQFNKYKGEKRKQLTYSKKKKKENRTSFTNALYLSIVPNTASWLAKNRDAILALIGSQVIVSALWLAQTSLQGVYTLHYTFTLLQHEREFFYLQQYLAQYYDAATSHASLAQPLVIMLHLSFLSVLLKTSSK